MIHRLVRAGNLAAVEELLQDSASLIHDRDDDGNTPLMVAAQNNNKKMVKFLLRKGADINAQNLTGQSALHFCYGLNFHELAKYLETKGADPLQRNALNLTTFEGVELHQSGNERLGYFIE